MQVGSRNYPKRYYSSRASQVRLCDCVFGQKKIIYIFPIENFRRALELMHRSTGLPVVDQQPVPTPVQPPALMDLQIAPPQQLEFKELVSQKCSERNILFAPMPGRRESGKQVNKLKHCALTLSVCTNTKMQYFRSTESAKFSVTSIVQLS